MAEPKPNAEPTHSTPEQRGDAKKGGADPFWLETAFPDPLASLGVVPPKIANLAADCVFVLDTNALLAPYKVGEGSFADIATIYSGLLENERLFVPARALREFLRNRNAPLVENYDHLYKLTSSLPILAELRCPMLEGLREYDAVVSAIDDIRKKVKPYKEALAALMEVVADWSWADSISTFYTRTFTSRVVIAPDLSNEQLLADLRSRFADKRPPGYKDQGKPDEGIGDVAIWHSVLALGSRTDRHVLLVTNEKKPDWVVKTQDQPLAARPELIAEFHRASGKFFGVISFTRFLEVMGAKPETIGRARVAESELRARFSFIEDRVASLISQIADIVAVFLATAFEDGSEYVYIGDPRFSSLVSEFVAANGHYQAMIGSSTGRDYLMRFEQVLTRMSSINQAIRALEVRMKRNADTEQSELREVCNVFLSIHGDWLGWRNYVTTTSTSTTTSSP